jgi:hypothetical protein
MAFEKKDKLIMASGIIITIIFFGITIYFRSGAF